MKFNLLGKISIIIVSLALLAGCGAALVRNVDGVKSGFLMIVPIYAKVSLTKRLHD
jgi:hypothetical protein